MEQLHDHVGHALGRDAVVVDLHHVRALDLGRRHRLAAEPGHSGGVVDNRGRHELHGDLGVEGQVIGDPDAPHAAPTELAHELDVLGDESAGLERHGPRVSQARASGFLAPADARRAGATT